MGADNGMSEQAAVDLAEMMRIGSTDEVHIVVQVDNAARDTNPYCRRYYVLKDSLRLLENLGEVDMADTAVLADFIGFLGSRFPARNYFLIIWDHGNGWRQGYGPQRAVIIDETSGRMMGVAGGELHRALAMGVKRLGRRLTILGFDACLMGSIEVAVEALGMCDYLLASEAVVPWDGFPYDALLGRLTARPTATPREFLPEMCADYVASHPGENVCLSAIDMAQLSRVLTVLGAALLGEVVPDGAGFVLARDGVQTFTLDALSPPSARDEQIDFIHFWQLAPSSPRVEELRSTLNPLVIANATSGNYRQAKGVSVWFPYSYLGFKGKFNEYRGLGFSDSIPWLSFLNNYYRSDDVKPTPPRILGHRAGGRGDVQLWWKGSFDLTPVQYRLYQGDEPNTVFLDGAHTLDNWESEGWTLSQRYSRSPGFSFFSGSAANLDNRLTLRTPLELPGGGLLSLYAFYWTEEGEDSLGNIQRDRCYLEWSGDRSNWFPRDSFYGQGDSWQEFRYLLPAGRVFLRFRYVTNDAINRLGVFIDDIRVQAFSFLRQATVTQDTIAYLFNLPRDTAGHYFFLTAVDTCGNVSMASQLYRVRVETWAEPYTRPAPFSGACDLVLDFPDGDTVDVFIYTISGTLVKKFLQVQEKVLRWDGLNEKGRALADGVYVVVVQGRGFKKSGKIARASRPVNNN